MIRWKDFVLDDLIGPVLQFRDETAEERARLAEATVRLVRLYVAWGKRDEAARWRARLGLADLPDEVFARP